jgi:hypothetical protein
MTYNPGAVIRLYFGAQRVAIWSSIEVLIIENGYTLDVTFEKLYIIQWWALFWLVGHISNLGKPYMPHIFINVGV